MTSVVVSHLSCSDVDSLWLRYLSFMLIAHWILTPVMASQLVVKPYWAPWACCDIWHIGYGYDELMRLTAHLKYDKANQHLSFCLCLDHMMLMTFMLHEHDWRRETLFILADLSWGCFFWKGSGFTLRWIWGRHNRIYSFHLLLDLVLHRPGVGKRGSATRLAWWLGVVVV